MKGGVEEHVNYSKSDSWFQKIARSNKKTSVWHRLNELAKWNLQLKIKQRISLMLGKVKLNYSQTFCNMQDYVQNAISTKQLCNVCFSRTIK